MFQFIRRVSGSLFPRPDRPWRDDATSHAPTIGRKRRHSVTEHDEDDSPSLVKRTKSSPIEPDTECDSPSEGENPKADAVPLVEGQGVKEVTEGVKEVELEDKDKVGDVSSVRPEGVPLPESPTGSPEPEPAKSDADGETNVQEYEDDKDSVASSAPKNSAEDEIEGSGRAEPETVATITGTTVDGTTSAQEVIITTVPEAGSYGTPETLEIRA